MLKKLLFVLLVVSLSQGAYAAAGDATAGEAATRFIEGLADDTLSIIKSVPDKKEKQVKLEALFSQHVDIPWIGRFVLGRFWKQASPAQQADYLNKYQGFIISHYTSHLTDYSDGAYRVINIRQDAADEFTVSMQIQPPNRDPIQVDYRVRGSGGGVMKIFDIVIEGVSLIATQRSEFSSVVQNKSLDVLIKQLEEKTAAARL